MFDSNQHSTIPPVGGSLSPPKAEDSDNNQHSKSFTLIELLVVVAIIAVLVAILLPALQCARQLAKTALCASNLRQMGMALMMYADEHNGRLPAVYDYNGNYTWLAALVVKNNYLPKISNCFLCPSAEPYTFENALKWHWPYRQSYGMPIYYNATVKPEFMAGTPESSWPYYHWYDSVILHKMDRPSNTFLLADSYELDYQRQIYYIQNNNHLIFADLRHNFTANTLMGDGSVQRKEADYFGVANYGGWWHRVGDLILR